MSPIKDIRVECDEFPLQGDALTLRWPFAPEGVEDARSSGLICATVVARAMWSRLRPRCWPEPKPEEDAITTYTFADFRKDLPGLKEALPEIWDRAKESASRQQGGETDDSFAGICRSPGFIRAFWINPRFQLTTAHYRAGWAYDERHVVLGGEDLTRQAVVAWDGVEPATLAQVINSLTFKESDDRRIMTFAFFRSPMLLQVDFTPGNGSDKSLADIQTFSADDWKFVPDPHGLIGGQGRWKVTGQVHYTIMAIVLHRETEDGVDSVRLFRGNGREELPEGTCEIEWPFDLDDPVPVGSKITVLYNSVSADSKVLNSLRPSERFPSPPLELQMEYSAQVGQGGAMAQDLSRLALARRKQAGIDRYKAPGSDAPPQSAQLQPVS